MSKDMVLVDRGALRLALGPEPTNEHEARTLLAARRHLEAAVQMPDSILRIRGRRERAGLTRQQLAHLAGCSMSHLTNLERGMKLGHSPVAARVLAALDAIERQA